MGEGARGSAPLFDGKYAADDPALPYDTAGCQDGSACAACSCTCTVLLPACLWPPCSSIHLSRALREASTYARTGQARAHRGNKHKHASSQTLASALPTVL